MEYYKERVVLRKFYSPGLQYHRQIQKKSQTLEQTVQHEITDTKLPVEGIT